MDDLILAIIMLIVELLAIAGVFMVLIRVVRFIYCRFSSTAFFNSSKFFNPHEYLPDEEILTLRQVFFLIMILLFVINMIYLVVDWNSSSINFRLLDIALSLYLALQIKRSSYKDYILLFLLIPLGSMSFLIFGMDLGLTLDLHHILAFVYFSIRYYRKFIEFSETNSLGITIMLLFSIIFISFLFTIPVEGVSPIDSLVMVSNAFTSNGYAVLGSTTAGKANALVLVWSGFILSGVSTATLAVAIVMKHVNGEFDRLEELVKKNKKN